MSRTRLRRRVEPASNTSEKLNHNSLTYDSKTVRLAVTFIEKCNSRSSRVCKRIRTFKTKANDITRAVVRELHPRGGRPAGDDAIAAIVAGQQTHKIGEMETSVVRKKYIIINDYCVIYNKSRGNVIQKCKKKKKKHL